MDKLPDWDRIQLQEKAYLLYIVESHMPSRRDDAAGGDRNS